MLDDATIQSLHRSVPGLRLGGQGVGSECSGGLDREQFERKSDTPPSVVPVYARVIGVLHTGIFRVKHGRDSDITFAIRCDEYDPFTPQASTDKSECPAIPRT